MTVILGPANADHYRVKVGRYGDRWYTDPLPGCTIADASDWQAPSWSIVKGAAGKDWSFVANKRNAHADRAELERIAGLDPEQRAQAFNAINRNGLNQAAGRGTIVHLWAEDLLAGKSPRTISDVDLAAMRLPKAALEEAMTYRTALVAFFDTYQPELVAAEYVALHRSMNGVGYGCTPDVAAVIEGDLLGVDWKSRGADSDHGAYPEEAAQIAAGARAEYMIVTGQDGQPCRATLPAMVGGIVVSIKPDGCRVYPVDLDKAFSHVEAMHAFWVARLTEKTAVGKPWAPRATPRALPPLDDLRDRIQHIIDAGLTDAMRFAWPAGVPTLANGGHSDEQLAVIAAAVTKVENEHSMPFMTTIDPPTTEPTPAPAPVVELDDGGGVDKRTTTALRKRMEALPAERLEQVTAIAAEAHAAGRSISVQAKPCVRRWEIARALVRWAETPGDLDNLAGALAVLATVEQIQTATTGDIGSLISLFTIEQARNLHDAFDTSVAA